MLNQLVVQYKNKSLELSDLYMNNVSSDSLIYLMCKSELNLIISEIEFHLKNKTRVARWQILNY